MTHSPAAAKSLFRTQGKLVASAAITVLLHCGITFALLYLQQRGNRTFGGGIGMVFLCFAAVHLSFLLGFVGPGYPGKVICGGVGYWVPSQAHDSFACLLLLMIGLVHFFGIAVIELETARIDCGVDLNAIYAKNGFDPTLLSSSSGAPVTDWTWAHGIMNDLDAAGCDKDDWTATFQARKSWTFTDRLYFSFVLTTTVGYGNTFTPNNPGLRVFTLVFAVYALVVFGAATFALGNAWSDLMAFITKHWTAFWARLKGKVEAAMDGTAATAASETAEAEEMLPAAYDDAKGLYINFIIFVVLNFVSALIFRELETGWTLFDAICPSPVIARVARAKSFGPASADAHAPRPIPR